MRALLKEKVYQIVCQRLNQFNTKRKTFTIKNYIIGVVGKFQVNQELNW